MSSGLVQGNKNTKYFNVRLVKMCFTLQIKNVNDFNKNKKSKENVNYT